MVDAEELIIAAKRKIAKAEVEEFRKKQKAVAKENAILRKVRSKIAKAEVRIAKAKKIKKSLEGLRKIAKIKIKRRQAIATVIQVSERKPIPQTSFFDESNSNKAKGIIAKFRL